MPEKEVAQQADNKTMQQFLKNFAEMNKYNALALILREAKREKEISQTIEDGVKDYIKNLKEQAKQFGSKAQQYAENMNSNSPEVKEYREQLEQVAGLYVDQMKNVLEKRNRSQEIKGGAMLSKVKIQADKRKAMKSPEYKAYQAEMKSIAKEINQLAKGDMTPETKKKITDLMERKEYLQDHSPLKEFDDKLNIEDRKIEAADKSIEECDQMKEKLGKEQKARLEQITKPQQLVEQQKMTRFQKLLGRITNLFKGGKKGLETFKSTISTQANSLKNSISDKVAQGKDSFNKAMDDLDQKIDETEKVVTGRLQEFGRGAKTVGENVIDGAKNVGENVIDGAKSVGNRAVDGAKTVGNKVVDGAKTVGNTAVQGAKVVGEGAAIGAFAVGYGAYKGAQAIGKGAQTVEKGIVTGAKTVGASFSKIANSVVEFGNKAANKVYDSIENGRDSAEQRYQESKENLYGSKEQDTKEQDNTSPELE